MKKTYLSFLLFLVFFISCTTQKDDTTDDITGYWKLIEIKLTQWDENGIPYDEWNRVEESDNYWFYIDFRKDFTFEGYRYLNSSCTVDGQYYVSGNKITLSYNCDDMTIGNPPGTFREQFYFEDKHLIITPVELFYECDETCLYKLKKTKDY